MRGQLEQSHHELESFTLYQSRLQLLPPAAICFARKQIIARPQALEGCGLRLTLSMKCR